ncbi:hypothetical protein PT974_05912 [Cladobotryum mycophilum]|uniref:Uncharacterized protein n=1 Tax=Cladobotryum mycophilum TaxID=491253 RepID=A0ABR0SK29_9HYPO
MRLSFIFSLSLFVISVMADGYLKDDSFLLPGYSPRWRVRPVTNTPAVNRLDMCNTLETMEAMMHFFPDIVKKIQASGSTVDTWKDGGVSVKKMLEEFNRWNSILKQFTNRLRATDQWSGNDQVRIASCYVDYSTQTTKALEFFEWIGAHIPLDESMGRTIFAVLIDTGKNYRVMAEELYRNIKGVKAALLTEKFPDDIPDFWCLKPSCEEKPRPKEKTREDIAYWIKSHDGPIISPGDKNGTFVFMLNTWKRKYGKDFPIEAGEDNAAFWAQELGNCKFPDPKWFHISFQLPICEGNPSGQQ